MIINLTRHLVSWGENKLPQLISVTSRGHSPALQTSCISGYEGEETHDEIGSCGFLLGADLCWNLLLGGCQLLFQGFGLENTQVLSVLAVSSISCWGQVLLSADQQHLISTAFRQQRSSESEELQGNSTEEVSKPETCLHRHLELLSPSYTNPNRAQEPPSLCHNSSAESSLPTSPSCPSWEPASGTPIHHFQPTGLPCLLPHPPHALPLLWALENQILSF